MESDASLLSKLQSLSLTDTTGIHRHLTAYLHPFTPFFAPSTSTTTTAVKKPAKSSKCKPQSDLPAIRPLAKQFLSFIHKSLSLIPKRLCESPKIPQNSALELFDSYRLCLDCLEVIAPELSGKPYSVQVQRIRYIHCLEHWDLFKEAEAEGLVVLERLNAIARGELKGKSGKLKARLVPELKEEGADRELAAIVLEVVVTLVKCASKRRSKVEADYWRVISLVNESEPCFKYGLCLHTRGLAYKMHTYLVACLPLEWILIVCMRELFARLWSWLKLFARFRILDAKDYDKFHHFLETNLHIITVFLVAELKSFTVDLIREFSTVTLKEYKKSCSQDQMYKVRIVQNLRSLNSNTSGWSCSIINAFFCYSFLWTQVALKICSSLFSQRDELSAVIIIDVLKHVLDFMAAECKVVWHAKCICIENTVWWNNVYVLFLVIIWISFWFMLLYPRVIGVVFKHITQKYWWYISDLSML